MTKVSPVKEKAMRLEKFVDAAMKDQLIMVFGVSPSYGMIAERLGYTEEKFKSIMHGDCHMSTIDKAATTIAGWTNELNAGYVTKGEKKMVKKTKQTKDELPELKTVDMNEDLDNLDSVEPINDDDDMDVLETLPDTDDDDLESLETIYDKEELESANSSGTNEGMMETSMSVASARLEQIKEEQEKKKFVPLTAKDKWENDAIAMGITDLNDDTMVYFDHKMDRLHVFKAPKGDLPYRQEISDNRAVGMSAPKIINYYDDEYKYSVKYVAIFEGEMELEACSLDAARAKVVLTVGDQKMIIAGEPLKFVDVNSSIVPVECDK